MAQGGLAMITLEKAYQILNVSPDASDEEIKKAYWEQAKSTHPDTHPNDPYAETKFQLLQKAKAKIDEDRKISYTNENTRDQNQSSRQNTYYSNNNNENGHHSNRTGSSSFARERSSILKILNEVYVLIKKRKYRNIVENAVYSEFAHKCAYGVLLRHALECIVHDKAKEIHFITEGRSSDELLSFIVDNYNFDNKTKKVFYDVKFITNKLTHVEHFSYPQISFNSCKEFYNSGFKQIIEEHLSSHNKKTQVYLRKIYNQLENFNIKNHITSTLLLGNVMRQILECVIDFWLYNHGFICDDRANINDKLNILLSYLQNAEFKQTYYTRLTIQNLHAIRIAVNQAIHVSSDNTMNIFKIRSGLLDQTGNLEIEIDMPTREQRIRMQNRVSLEKKCKKVLLWIFFHPIMLAITIGKSEIGLFFKIILIYLCVVFALFELLIFAILSIDFFVLLAKCL